MAEKVTRMLIKVDLQCDRCYKKIKKILCKFPQIQDQIYDEKQNTVLITVVCCSPEKIRDKIIRKGGKTVQSVEILPDKPKEPEKKPEKKPDKPKEPEKKPDKPPEKPQDPVKKPEKPKDPVKEPEKPKEPEKKPEKPKEPEKKPLPPPVPMYPVWGVCCCPCYEGYGGGPCYYHGQGRPVMCYDGCGRPAYECQGGNRGYYVSRCDYFSEENPTGCTVM